MTAAPILSNPVVTAGLALLGLFVLGLFALWLLVRHERRRAAAEPTWYHPFNEIIDVGDPLDESHPVDQLDLADPLLFAELSATHPVRLDWQPPTFTQEWMSAGETMRQLGDTQTFERIAA